MVASSGALEQSRVVVEPDGRAVLSEGTALMSQSETWPTGRAAYDSAIESRLAMLAELACDSLCDAIEALEWTRPGDDELTIIRMEATRLNERVTEYRKESCS